MCECILKKGWGGSKGDFTPIAIYTPKRMRFVLVSVLPFFISILARPIWNCLSLYVYIHMHIRTNKREVQKCFIIAKFGPHLKLLTHHISISYLYQVIFLTYSTHFLSYRVTFLAYKCLLASDSTWNTLKNITTLHFYKKLYFLYF